MASGIEINRLTLEVTSNFTADHDDQKTGAPRKSLVWKVRQTCTGIRTSVTSAAQRSVNSFAHSRLVATHTLMSNGRLPAMHFPLVAIAWIGQEQNNVEELRSSLLRIIPAQSLLARCSHSPFPFLPPLSSPLFL